MKSIKPKVGQVIKKHLLLWDVSRWRITKGRISTCNSGRTKRKPLTASARSRFYYKIGGILRSTFSEAGYRTSILAAVIMLMPLTLVVSGDPQTPFIVFGDPSGDLFVHHFEMSCDNCHEPVVGTFPGESGGNMSLGKVRGDINKLCTQYGCHNFEPSLNHPVGVVPGGEVPEDMPLGSGSRITCLTCHDEQNSSSALFVGSNSNKNMLRRSAGIQLCAACHAKNSRTLLEQSHWRFSTRAHLGSINLQSPADEDYVQLIGGVDVESRLCLSCHEDISVSVPPENETPRQKRIRLRTTSNHPIGMLYENIALRRAGSYQYPLFDQRIRLFSGRVGCGSCHSLYARTEKNLVVRNERSTLCFKCHNK